MMQLLAYNLPWWSLLFILSVVLYWLPEIQFQRAVKANIMTAKKQHQGSRLASQSTANYVVRPRSVATLLLMFLCGGVLALAAVLRLIEMYLAR